MSNTPIYNEKGQVIGHKQSDGTYLKPTGEVAARVKNGVTLDKEGKVKGKGDQGLRFI